MSDSDFEEFEEPEEPEIVEDMEEKANGNIDKEVDKNEGKAIGNINDEKEVVLNKKEEIKDDNKSKGEETKEIVQEETEDSIKKEITSKMEHVEEVIKTPEKKTKNTVSSAQKPNSVFHPVSQDSDLNLNSKLSESFSMITNDAKIDGQSGIDSKNESHNMISPSNQLEKIERINNPNKIERENSKESRSVPKKKKQNIFLIKFPKLCEWANKKEKSCNIIQSTKKGEIREIKDHKSQIGTKKSLMGRFRKLKIYKKLVKMKEEIQNNSCKEMKGLNKTESELLNEFLNGLYILPDSVNKDLFEI